LLNERLAEAGRTQEQLAKYLKKTQGFVSKVANGVKPMNLEFAINAAEFLNCEIRSLYEWERVK
jgi:transcriptional regulator with XRE-family HTH domain